MTVDTGRIHTGQDPYTYRSRSIQHWQIHTQISVLYMRAADTHHAWIFGGLASMRSRYRSCHVFYDPICFHDWDKTTQNQSETLNARNFHANLTTGGHILIHDWKIRTLFESHENIFPCSCDFDQFWSESTDFAACGSFRRTIVSAGMRAGFYTGITGTCRTL